MTDKTIPTPDTPQPVDDQNKSKLGKLKLAFLYVLIGGLVLSALISVVAILIGEFNSMVQKAIITTVSLVIHSSLVLLVVLADRNNQLGKSIVPTTFVVTIIASMITSSLGLWDVWSDDISWRMVNVYALVIGTAFLVDGLLRLRLQKQVMQVLPYLAIGLFVLLMIAFAPWILFFDQPWVTDLYYRIIGAIAILAVTALVITAIVNRISVAQNPELAKNAPKLPAHSQGMLGIVITLGVVTSFFWFFGLTTFLYQASTYEARKNPPVCSQYNRSYDCNKNRYE